MRKPSITISATDHVALTRIANGLLGTRPVLAEALIGELERARVVRASSVPARSVQMGSMVEYTTEDGKARRVQLVYPAEADIAKNRISVLTPVGTALLGLSVGQSIDWVGNDGRKHVLSVTAVEPGSAPIPGAPAKSLAAQGIR